MDATQQRMLSAEISHIVGKRLHSGERADRAGKLLRPTSTMMSLSNNTDGGGPHTGGRRLIGRACILVAAVAALALSGCAGTGAQAGTALDPGYATVFGIAPLRPGDQVGMLDVGLWNRSNSPLTITAITVPGRGVGTVIRVIEVKIAPDRPLSSAVFGGAYSTDPPVQYTAGHCRQQVLKPVHGYTMAPGAKARVWVVIQDLRPGRFAIREHIIRYTQNGTRYQQAIQTGYKGSVARNAKYLAPISWQARCVGPMHARFLTNIKRRR